MKQLTYGRCLPLMLRVREVWTYAILP